MNIEVKNNTVRLSGRKVESFVINPIKGGKLKGDAALLTGESKTNASGFEHVFDSQGEYALETGGAFVKSLNVGKNVGYHIRYYQDTTFCVLPEGAVLKDAKKMSDLGSVDVVIIASPVESDALRIMNARKIVCLWESGDENTLKVLADDLSATLVPIPSDQKSLSIDKSSGEEYTTEIVYFV